MLDTMFGTAPMVLPGLGIRIAPVEMIGYAAALAVFLTFCMTTMLPLRIIAVLSNVLFISYAYLGDMNPILVLHSLLLPVNVWRLRGILHLARSAKAPPQEFDFATLRSHMTERRLRAGDVVFRRGDQASEMYYVQSGEILIPEVDAICGPRDIFGEMGIFATARRRSASAVAKTDAVLWVLTDEKVRVLYFQHPGFTLRLVSIIVDRLLENAGKGQHPPRQDDQAIPPA